MSGDGPRPAPKRLQLALGAGGFVVAAAGSFWFAVRLALGGREVQAFADWYLRVAPEGTMLVRSIAILVWVLAVVALLTALVWQARMFRRQWRAFRHRGQPRRVPVKGDPPQEPPREPDGKVER